MINNAEKPQLTIPRVIGCLSSVKDKYQIKSIDTEMVKEWCLKKHYAKLTPICPQKKDMLSGDILLQRLEPLDLVTHVLGVNLEVFCSNHTQNLYDRPNHF